MSGSINFNSYPVSQRNPGVFAEIDPQATPGTVVQRTLIIGQSLLGAGANAIGLATGLSQVKSVCGPGSQVALMYEWYRKRDTLGEVWIAPVADDSAAVMAQGAVNFVGTATASGTISLYIAGTLVAIPVTSGTTGAQVATAAVVAINSNPDMPVLAQVVSATPSSILLGARNKGPWGNEIDVRLNYFGSLGGEATPAGLSITCTPTLTGGTQNPLTGLQAAIGALGSRPFDFIVCPFTDTASLNALQTFLDANTGRWSWQQMIYGGVFYAVRGTAGALQTFGSARNSYTECAIGFYDSPTPPSLWAAQLAAVAAVSLRADPSLPMHDLALDVLPPSDASQFGASTRNTLLYSGISTFEVRNGVVYTSRLITTYQEDASGAEDTTWLNLSTPYQTVDLVRDMDAFLRSSFANKAVVADGSTISGGSNRITSQTVLAAAQARYRSYCDAGRAQDYAGFKAGSSAKNLGGGLIGLVLPFRTPTGLQQIVMKIALQANT